MKTVEEKVKESSVINIIMKSDNLLEEVVVAAYVFQKGENHRPQKLLELEGIIKLKIEIRMQEEVKIFSKAL